MMAELSAYLLIPFLVFCRVGACFSLAAGLSSPRAPVVVRLLLAMAAAAAITPLVGGSLGVAAGLPGAALLPAVLHELAVGTLLGLASRCFLSAAQFAATLMANLMGLAGIPGLPLDESEALVPLAGLISLSASALFIAAGLHVEILRTVIDSYSALPPGASLDIAWAVDMLLAAASAITVLGLKLAAPIAVYSMTVNLALGLAGRFAPRLQVYFVSAGGIIIGGLIVLAVTMPEGLIYLTSAYGAWLGGQAL